MTCFLFLFGWSLQKRNVFFLIFYLFLTGLIKQNRTSKRADLCVITAEPCFILAKPTYNDAICVLPETSKLEKKLRDMTHIKSADLSPVVKAIVALKSMELETGCLLEFLKFECTALGIWCKFCKEMLRPYFGYSRKTAQRLITQYSGAVPNYKKTGKASV